MSHNFSELLKKDAPNNGETKTIAILWVVIKDEKLVKTVLGVKYKDVHESFARGLNMTNYASMEIPNLVEAVKKIWQGKCFECSPTSDKSSTISLEWFTSFLRVRLFNLLDIIC